MDALLENLDPFMDKIVLSLQPFFVATSATVQDARKAIVMALASYGTRTEAEMVEAAQILALGFATLESLSEASAEGLPATTRIRLRANANVLVRAKKQCQQGLGDSLATEIAEQAEPPPINGEPEADLTAAIHHARAMASQAGRQVAPTMTRPPEPDAISPSRSSMAELTTQQRNRALWASAMQQVIGQIMPNSDPPPA